MNEAVAIWRDITHVYESAHTRAVHVHVLGYAHVTFALYFLVAWSASVSELFTAAPYSCEQELCLACEVITYTS